MATNEFDKTSIFREPVNFGYSAGSAEVPPSHALSLDFKLNPALAQYQESLTAFMRLTRVDFLTDDGESSDGFLSKEQKARLEEQASDLPIVFEPILSLARFGRFPNHTQYDSEGKTHGDGTIVNKKARKKLYNWAVPHVIGGMTLQSDAFSSGGRKFAVEITKENGYYASLLALLQKMNPIYVTYPPPSLTLTIKGTGSRRRRIMPEDLEKNDHQIDGFGTHHTNDIKIQQELQGEHQVRGIYGETMTYNYIPGRYLIVAFPIEQIGFFREGINRIEYRANLNSYDFHMRLATGENQLHVEVYIETGGLDLQDINNEAYKLINYQSMQRIYDEKALLKALTTIRKKFVNHPHFGDLASIRVIENSDHFIQAYLKRHIETAFAMSQVEARYIEYGGNRSLQNTLADASSTDWEDSRLFDQATILTPDTFEKNVIYICATRLRNLRILFEDALDKLLITYITDPNQKISNLFLRTLIYTFGYHRGRSIDSSTLFKIFLEKSYGDKRVLDTLVDFVRSNFSDSQKTLFIEEIDRKRNKDVPK